MYHMGCPVLYGDKWIGNKWIRWNSQMDTFKCFLPKTENYLSNEQVLKTDRWWRNLHLNGYGTYKSEFPTIETLVGFGDSSGVGFEKVDGLFLIFKVAREIWIAKLDFHLYPQKPPKPKIELSWEVVLKTSTVWLYLYLPLDLGFFLILRFRNLQFRPRLMVILMIFWTPSIYGQVSWNFRGR